MAGLLRMRLDCYVSTSRKRRDEGTRKVTRSLLLGTCAQSVSHSVQQEPPLAVDFNITQFYRNVLDPNSGIRQYLVDWQTLKDRLTPDGDCFRSVLMSKEGGLFERLVSNLTDAVSIPFHYLNCITDDPSIVFTKFLMSLEDLCRVGEFFCGTVIEGLCVVRQCVFGTFLNPGELDLELLSRMTETHKDDHFRNFLTSCYRGGATGFPNVSQSMEKVVCSSSVTEAATNSTSLIPKLANLVSMMPEIANSSSVTPAATTTTTPSAESDIIADFFVGMQVVGGFVIVALLYKAASLTCGLCSEKLMSWRLRSRREAASMISPESLASESCPMQRAAGSEEEKSEVFPPSKADFYVDMHPAPQESRK